MKAYEAQQLKNGFQKSEFIFLKSKPKIICDTSGLKAIDLIKNCWF